MNDGQGHREVGNRALLVVSVMLATLMQALDTTIANVALPNMQGTLSASQDEIAWVLTSYIVAAAIATPATGWLASVFGRRRLLLITVTGFTGASILCGIATHIDQMVLFRLLQGLFGAALVPVSQSTLLDVFPREKHGAAMAMWGMGVMVGPILGPPLGGWLTDNHSWHWVFLINVPIGVLCLFGVAASLPADDTKALRFDWRGFVFLAMGIGALQMLLDRGQLKDWFDAPEIRIEAALAFLGFYLYVVHWLSSPRSFVDLGLFRDRNFLASNIFIFVIGVVLFATMALLPPYLQTLMNYPVVTVGMLLAPRGLGTMIAMLIVGRLLARGADPRLVAGIGMLFTAYSLWTMTQWTSDVPQWDIIAAGIVQGVGVGLVFVPVSTVAYSTLPMASRTEAAGIYSLTRNIGSSVGISIMMALLARGTQINHAELAVRLTPFDKAVLPHMSGLSAAASLEALNNEVTRQAATMSFLNDFWLMMILTLAATPLLILLRPVRHAAPAEAALAVE